MLKMTRYFSTIIFAWLWLATPLFAQTTEKFSTYVLGLPSVSSLVGTEKIPLTQSGVAMTTTAQQILAGINGIVSPTTGLSIGGCNTSNQFICATSTATFFPQEFLTNQTNDANGPYYLLQKARGVSGGSAAAVHVNDYLGSIQWQGADSNGTMQQALSMGVSVFGVAPGSVTPVLNFTGNSSGSMSFVENLGTGSHQIISTNSVALVVGPTLANPTFNVNSSVASAVTGLNIQGQASGGGFGVAVTSPATNEGLAINAKGNGTILLNNLGSGNVQTGGLIETGTTTVGNLPTCNAGLKAAKYFVTDNNTALSFAAVVTAGGAIQTPVYCDGTTWRQG